MQTPTSSPRPWLTTATQTLISSVSLLVFAFLDLADFLLCFAYHFLDHFLEGGPGRCYCRGRGSERGPQAKRISETLYGRRNLFREIVPVGFDGECCGGGAGERKGVSRRTRWSDCGCESCRSWQRRERRDERLHLVVKEPASDSSASEDHEKSSIENVIFLHGFLSSSNFWTETVFPNLSESAKVHYRMFAVDLLGFGRSPKPTEGLYTMEDHIEMIEISVLKPFQLDSFHLVAHSMGSIIALALAAKYPKLVKSITLVAPPYFPANCQENASYAVLNRVAERKIWPPILFGSSVMSWYEHLGRTVCFVLCRNHLLWEWLIKLVTRRDVHFMIRDLTKHTHHSAWHTMHNVVCGAADSMDGYLEVVKREGTPFRIVQGSEDQLVPRECGFDLKLRVPHAEVHVVANADHSTMVVGREKDFTRELEEFWSSSRKHEMLRDTMSTH